MTYGMRVPLSALAKYDVVICVAGSRSFNQYDHFRQYLSTQLSEWADLLADKKICWLSGMASKGPDNMIIKWCIEESKPYAVYPADWDGFGKQAGYIRNDAMAKISHFLIAFHDGVSKGTKHMISLGRKYRLTTRVFIVDPDAEVGYVQKPEESRGSLFGADCEDY